MCAYFKKWMDFIGTNSEEGKNNSFSDQKDLEQSILSKWNQQVMVLRRLHLPLSLSIAQSWGIFSLTFNEVASQILQNKRPW